MRIRGPLRVSLAVTDGIVGLTAVGGGIAMAARLESFPERWLERTPFTSYLAPGVLLATVVGGSAVAATAATARSPRIGGYASIGAGVVLASWIAAEIALLPRDARHWIEPAYLGLAAAMAALGAASAGLDQVPVGVDAPAGGDDLEV